MMTIQTNPMYEHFVGEKENNNSDTKKNKGESNHIFDRNYKNREICALITAIVLVALSMLGTSGYIFYRDGKADLVVVSFSLAIVILVVAGLCCFQWR